MIEIDITLRKLARSNYWQSLYHSVKECHGIRLFRNESNLSGLQIRFLYWLKVYSILYDELSTHEDKLLTQDVIDDDLRCDAYLVYRNKKHDYLWRKHRREEAEAQRSAGRKSKFNNPGKQSSIEVNFRRE